MGVASFAARGAHFFGAIFFFIAAATCGNLRANICTSFATLCAFTILSYDISGSSPNSDPESSSPSLTSFLAAVLPSVTLAVIGVAGVAGVVVSVVGVECDLEPAVREREEATCAATGRRMRDMAEDSLWGGAEAVGSTAGVCGVWVPR